MLLSDAIPFPSASWCPYFLHPRPVDPPVSRIMAGRGGARPKSAKAKAKAAAKTAAALAALQPAAPLFERQEAEEASASGRASRKRTRSVDEIISKILRDNFPHLKPGQATLLLNKAGKSLYEVLRKDREKVEAGAPDAPTIGKHYYARLREEFAYADNPARRLRVSDDSEIINEELMSALADLHKYPRSFERSMTFLEGKVVPNQRSLVLLFRQALSYSPNGGQDTTNFHMSLLGWVARNDVATKFPAEWLAVRNHLDEAASRALSAWKSTGMQSKVWWECNKGALSLLMPRDDTDQCMAETENYMKVEDALCRVVQSSVIGSRLFGAAHRQYQASKITTLIRDLLAILVAKPITAARIEECRTEFIQRSAARGRDCKESLPKRSVEMCYRGWNFPMEVFSFYDEYLMAEACQVETLAVDQGLLPALFCESELVPEDRAAVVLEIDDEVLAPAKSVRRAVAAGLAGDTPSGDNILHSLTMHAGQYNQLHRPFRAQIAFWTSIVGAGSEQRLHSEVLKCLGTSERPVTVTEACQRLAALEGRKLIAFCGLGLQTTFSSCKAFVNDIKNDRQPQYDGANDSPFLQSVMERCADFFKVEVPVTPQAEPRTLHGRAAVVHKLEALRGAVRAGETIELKEVQCLKIFGWLLKPSEFKEVDAWVNDCIKADIVSAADHAASSSSTAAPRSKAGRKKVAPSARDAVMKLLS